MSQSSKYKNFEEARQANPDLPNIGKPWTTEQENLLMKSISEGKTHEEISKEFGRTTGGIRGRLRQIACEMVDLGKSIEYASEKTKLNKLDIEQSLAARNIKKEKPLKSKYEKIVSKAPEVVDLKYEIKEIKNDIKELKEMLKSFMESIVVQE